MSNPSRPRLPVRCPKCGEGFPHIWAYHVHYEEVHVPAVGIIETPVG